ncbi:MAG: DUF6152 family protein [Gammaproteobacteria bacterium]|nr:DUF6152 family protein [Gammaproteobacteria bacterium]MDH3507732.1 DUF6152 family protein [Gammaproteobacteria bacterium]
MGVTLRRLAFIGTGLLMASPATAHHSRAIYDLERNVTIEGVVTKFDWANPHVYLYVEAQSAGGEPVVWEIENGSTTAMGRRGWTRESFAPGDRVIVEANPSKDPNRHAAVVTTVTKSGVTWIGRGRLAEEFSQSLDASVTADGLTGTWVVPQAELVGYFSEPDAWPLTPKASAAVESYDDLSMNPQIQCISRTAPWVMIFPSVQRIEVGDTLVSIRSEYDTVERTVHMNVSSHDGAEPAHQGHSIGWWEGETLVIDTTHFSNHRSGNARGVPSGSSKHVVERYELNADRTGLTYSFVLEDPEHLTAPVSGEVHSAYRPDVEFSPVPCDAENARRFLGN